MSHNYIVEHHGRNVLAGAILVVSSLPVMIATVAVLGTAAHGRDQCDTGIGLNAWTWLLVKLLLDCVHRLLIPGVRLKLNNLWLERYARIRTEGCSERRATTASSLLNLSWTVVGFVLVSGIDSECPSAVKPMILAACILEVLSVCTIAAVMVCCLPIVMMLARAFVVPSYARPLEPEEVAQVITFSATPCPGDISCTICLDDMERGEITAKQLRCMHWFHEGCIVPWLAQHNTCPLCRVVVYGQQV